jgi:hypothetical protein
MDNYFFVPIAYYYSINYSLFINYSVKNNIYGKYIDKMFHIGMRKKLLYLILNFL